MKTKAESLSRLRSLIRWTSGTAVTAAIITGSCVFFPALAGSAAALVLTSAFAVFVGLGVALPPINPEEDWVPLGRHPVREVARVKQQSTVRQPAAKVAQAVKAQAPRPIQVQPVHVARAHGGLLYRILHPGHKSRHRQPAHSLGWTDLHQNRLSHHPLSHTLSHTLGHN